MKWVKTLTGFKRPIYVCMEDYGVSSQILHHGTWEQHISQYLSDNLKPDDVFLDVGANIGFFSLLAAHRFEVLGGAGRVIAVEANPVVLPYFMSAVVESGLEHRVHVLPYAASDSIGLMQIREDFDWNLGGLTVSACDSSVASKRRIIPAVRLDDILVDLDRLDCIKMDIEGAEALAIRGMTNLLGRFTPDIITEVNKVHLESSFSTSVFEFVSMMDRLGYRPHFFADGVRPASLSDVMSAVEAEGYYDFLFKHVRRLP